ncbi:MAG: hypothetical protein ACYDEN_09735 [Acidimicrobiales bacterium]
METWTAGLNAEQRRAVAAASTAAEPAAARRVQAGTFRSVAHQVLGDGLSVLDRADTRDLMGLVRAPGAREAVRRFPPAWRRWLPCGRGS